MPTLVGTVALDDVVAVVLARGVTVLDALELALCAVRALCVLVLDAVVVVLGPPPPHADASAPPTSAVTVRGFSAARTLKPWESGAPGGPGRRSGRAAQECGRASHWLARFRPVMDRRSTTTSQGYCVVPGPA